MTVDNTGRKNINEGRVVCVCVCICLSISLSLCLLVCCVCVFAALSVSVYMSVDIFICLHVHVYLSSCLSICMCLSVYWPAWDAATREKKRILTRWTHRECGWEAATSGKSGSFASPQCAHRPTRIKKQTLVIIRDNYLTCLGKCLASMTVDFTSNILTYSKGWHISKHCYDFKS